MSDVVYFIESGRKRKGEKVECLVCGIQFARRIKPQKGHKPQETCSKECRGILARKRTQVICENCGRTIERSASKLLCSKHSVYFCDRKCKDAAQKIGGCEKIQPPHYGTGNGKYNYRERCSEKLSNGCECGVKEQYKLIVHHKDGNRENNVDDNLEAVCANCHIKRHLKLVDGVWMFSYQYLTPRELLDTIP